MKILALLAAVIGVVILPTGASAQTNYLAQEIVPAETTGPMGTAALNNKGEAAITYDGTYGVSSSRVELWLPNARNGLPAGSTKVASVGGFSIKLTDSLRWAFSFSSDRYYWDGVLHQLPLYPGMTDTYLNDLNDNGTMVGQSVNRNSTNTNTKTAAHVINGGLFSDFWEMLPGSGPNDKYWPYRINKVGDIAGQHPTEVYNGAAWQHTLVGAFLRRNGVVHHIPPTGPAIGEQWTVYDLNEKGQVLVLRQPPAGSGQPQQFYLYLPVVDYGWPSAGLIGPVTEYSQRYPRLNNQGQISGLMWVGATNYAPLIWNRGVWLDIRTLPIVQPGFAALRALHINDHGQILCRGTVPGKPGEHPMLLTPSPGLFATFLFPTNRLSLGEEMDFTVRVVNGTLETLNDVRIVSLEKDSGAGGLERVSGPTPGNPVSLPRGGFVEQQYRYRATNGGSFVFAANLEGRRTNNTLLTARSLSDPLKILIRGDLLIKRAAESASRYGIDNDYQSNPSGQQVRTNLAKLTDSAEFQVKIENDDPLPRTFVLKATDYGTNGWDMKYLFNNQNIAAQLAVGGFTLPQLASSASHTITVRMTPTNAPGGDQRRVLLQLESSTEPGVVLDIVEAVTDFAGEIIVNTTGDEPDYDLEDGVPDVDLVKPGLQTTLRCAIDFANRRAGADVIKFQIPAEDPNYNFGYPLIRPATALSNIVDSVMIDGLSQNPASQRPTVELSGRLLPRTQSPVGSFPLGYLLTSDEPSGLQILAPNCEIRGLMVTEFPFTGIRVRADYTTIQGNYVGLQVRGGASYPAANGRKGIIMMDHTAYKIAGIKGAGILIESGFNQIGGSQPSEANVVSGLWIPPEAQGDASDTQVGPGILVAGSGALGNIIEGNIIGLDPNGENETFLNTTGFRRITNPLAGVMVMSGAKGNWIGTLDAPNVIANAREGVLLALGADLNIVAKNLIGTDSGGKTIVRYPSDASMEAMDGGANGHGIFIFHSDFNVIGGDSPEKGNQIAGMVIGIHVTGGKGNAIKNNFVGCGRDGTILPNFSGMNFSEVTSGEVSANQIRFNELRGATISASSGLTFAGNLVESNGHEGILALQGNQNLTIVSNTITANGRGVERPLGFDTQDGITILDEPNQVYIVQNQIYNNAGLGISFTSDGAPLANDGDAGDVDSGPNGLQNYPKIHPFSGATLSAGQLHIKGDLATKQFGGLYTIHFYSSPSADSKGFGEGSNYVGSTQVNVGALGSTVIDVTLPAAVSVFEYLTATATDSGLNTSEFSAAVMIQDCEPGISGLCPGTEANVPSLPSGSPQPMGGGPVGDGNGDGIADSTQANVASLPTFSSLWMTLATTNGAVLAAIAPVGSGGFLPLPANYIFPVGFLSFGITNFPLGGSIVVTNFLHLNASPDVAYTATTFFNFGPTPGNVTPHWYEFNYDGMTGAQLLSNRIVLHFQDGARGDNDLVANGSIVTTGGPAQFHVSAPGPVLSVLSVGVQPGSTFTSNALTAITLAWPQPAKDYIIETTASLSLTNVWEPLLKRPVLTNGQFVLTHLASEPKRFYRLKRLLYPDAFFGTPIPNAPVLNLQRTSTNTFLLSWLASFTGFALQQNPNLFNGTWTSVTNSVNVSAGQNQVVVAPATGSRFFRLQSP